MAIITNFTFLIGGARVSLFETKPEYMRTVLELRSGKRELVEINTLHGVRSPRGLPAGGCARRAGSLPEAVLATRAP